MSDIVLQDSNTDADHNFSTIDRHKRDKKSNAVQTQPGWCSAPFTGKHHYVPIQHM